MKECDCTVKTTGLPTVYPTSFNYCPKCGKKLIEKNEASILKEMQKK